MKRTKLWKSLGAVVALAAPMTPMLTSLTSCNKINYFQIAKKFKTTALEHFMNLSKCKRQTWQEKEAYDYIINTMKSYGYDPAGYDEFGSMESTQKAAIEDMPKERPYDPNLNQYGNVWFDLPATKGYDFLPRVILHAHQDVQMAFKDDTAYNNWRKSGVDVYYDQDQQIMYAKDYNTSLGADDGVGCAELLAIAAHAKDEDFPHGKIRLLFTCDESGAVNQTIDEKEYVYQSGAGLLKEDQEHYGTPGYEKYGEKPFNTKYVINLDGYDQHDVVRSCAGIHECIYDKMNITGDKIEEIPWTDVGVERHEYELTVNITRPEGANSGSDANKGYANALKILSQVIVEWNEDVPKTSQVFRLVSATCEGGAYTICPKASARFVSYLDAPKLKNKCDEFKEMFEALFPNEIGKIKITFRELTGETEELKRDKYCFEAEYSRNIFYLINVLEFGPVTWLDRAKTKVKTSYNVGPLIASIKYDEEAKAPVGSVNFHTVSRSADELQQTIFRKRIHAYFSYYFELDDPTKDLNDIENDVWETSSENAKMADFIYGIEKSFKYSPVYTDIHSWAEISQFPKIIEDAGLGKAQMASFGPTVTGTHTRQETFYVNSLDSVLKTLVYALMNMNKISE